MSRKADDNLKQMDDEVIKCFIDSNGQEVTTQAERREVAEMWCAGDYSHHRNVAAKHGLQPIALIIAALIDIDHPLLVSGRGVAYNSIKCAMIIIQTMNSGNTVAQPINNSFHSLPVERIKR
jgi:hypothetical protein